MLNAESVLVRFRRRNFFSGIVMELADGNQYSCQSVQQTAFIGSRKHVGNSDSAQGAMLHGLRSSDEPLKVFNALTSSLIERSRF